MWTESNSSNWTVTVVIAYVDIKLKVHRSRLQLRQRFFSQRVVNTWNRLSALVVQAPTVNNFKKRLDDWSTDVDF